MVAMQCLSIDHTGQESAYGCSKEFVLESGNIYSPYYPGNYSSNYKECLAHIRASTNSEIMITFNVFDVEFDEECSYDAVEVMVVFTSSLEIP